MLQLMKTHEEENSSITLTTHANMLRRPKTFKLGEKCKYRNNINHKQMQQKILFPVFSVLVLQAFSGSVFHRLQEPELNSVDRIHVVWLLLYVRMRVTRLTS